MPKIFFGGGGGTRTDKILDFRGGGGLQFPIFPAGPNFPRAGGEGEGGIFDFLLYISSNCTVSKGISLSKSLLYL